MIHMIDDEKITAAGEALKKEDAAPAPARALETAKTSETTDSDITTDTWVYKLGDKSSNHPPHATISEPNKAA